MKTASWQDKGITPNELVILPPEQEVVAELLTPHEDAQVQAAVTKLEETMEVPMGTTTTTPDSGTTTLDPSATSATDSETDGTTTTTKAE